MKKGWQLKRLGDLGINYFKGVSPKEKRSNGDLVLIPSGAVFPSGIKFERTKRFASSDVNVGNKILIDGDILFNCGGVGTLGRSAIFLYGSTTDKAVSDSFVLVIRSKNTDALNRFIFYFLQSEQANEKIIANTRGTTGITSIRTEAIMGFEIPIPPLAEQQRIVGLLDEAFEGLATAKANAEKNLQNARALFESHLHVDHAEKAILGDLVNIKTGKLDANAAVEGGKFPFFTCSRDIFAIDTFAFDCEAILLAGNNAVGDFNVKHYNGKFNAYQRTYVITVNEKKRVLYRFLYFQMLKSLKKFKAQSVGAGTKFLKLGMIKELEIELPSLDEQQRIVSTMDSVREETQRLARLYERKLAALEALKKSLLYQAFNGGLV